MLLEKNVLEVSYLNTENTFRYRPIIRIAYKFYENMRYWIYVEDIYNEIIKYENLREYTIEQLKSDLDALTKWGNFQTIQDTKKTKSIEEFKNRKFRYQISPVTIELERTLISIESLSEGKRGSLEISLMERFNDTLSQFEKIDNFLDGKKIFSLWELLYRDFKHLNENYQDYLSKFSNPKTDEIIKATEFLIFKESFIKYLNEFIKGIQTNVPSIVRTFKRIDKNKINDLIKSIIEYEESIYIGNEYDKEEVFNNHLNKFEGIKDWFLGSNGNLPITDQLLESTNEIIRKITRYALQIADLNNESGNRVDEYRKIISLFNEVSDDELSLLSAAVFGAYSSRHVVSDKERETESINSSIYDEGAIEILVNPSTRGYREKKANNSFIKDKGDKKKDKFEKVLLGREEEKRIMQGLIKDNRIDFGVLSNISKEEKNILLRWLSRIIARKGKGFVTNELGLQYRLKELYPKERIVLKSEDGDLEMPRYEFIFREDN